MNNLLRDFRAVMSTVPASETSGAPVVVEGIPGVLEIDADSTPKATVNFETRLYTMSVSAVDDDGDVAVSEGDFLYYTEADDIQLSKKRNTGQLWGVALHATPGSASSALVASGSSGSIAVLCLGIAGKAQVAVDPLKDDNGNEVLDLIGVASAVNHPSITNAVTTEAPEIAAAGSDTNIGLDIKSKGTGVVRLLVGSLVSLVCNAAASAVNYLQVTASATSNAVGIAALGSDDDVPVNVASKGQGAISLLAGALELLVLTPVASAVNYLGFTAAATGNAVQINALGDDDDIDIDLNPKGTGVLDLDAIATDSTLTNDTIGTTAEDGYLSIRTAAGVVKVPYWLDD